MKKLRLLLLLAIMSSFVANAQDFDTFFENKSLRMDVFHCGMFGSAEYVFDKFVVEQ